MYLHRTLTIHLIFQIPLISADELIILKIEAVEVP